MRAGILRLLAAAAVLAAGCGKTVKLDPGPLDRLYLPTGMAVQRFGAGVAGARLVVVSSNGDLRYDLDSGGSVIAYQGDFAAPAGPGIVGALNVRSFGGDLALVDPAACATAGVTSPHAVVAFRGSNYLDLLRIDPAGQLACVSCDIPLTGPFGDPLAVGVACSATRARAFVGYLATKSGEGWVSEVDLTTGAIRSFDPGPGNARGFAYDPLRDRLYILATATASPTPVRFVDLDGCQPGLPAGEGGCRIQSVPTPAALSGLEFRSFALAPPQAGRPRRAYLTGRTYDLNAAATYGNRTSDFGGILAAVDLVEDALGGLTFDVVHKISLGSGAQDVRVLPRSPAWAATRRDIVAAVTVDEAALWLYDDETGSVTSFTRDPATGIPLLGEALYGLAVDPEPIASAARLYVGTYASSFVTPIDVPLDDPSGDPVTHAGYAGGAARRIGGGTP